MSAIRTDISPDIVDLKRFLSEPVLIAAVSGGSDSTALLLLLKQAIERERAPARLIAATVDHGLRPESADEATAVGRLCARLAVPHHIVCWTGDKPKTGLPAAARLARHALLAGLAQSHGARIVLTGHTLDDQAETVVMRRQRGEGLGLAGIAPATLFEGRVWFARPLLESRRSVLRDYLRRNGLSWIDDPSNDNEAFERPRVRKMLGGTAEGPATFADAVDLSRRTAAQRQDLAGRAARLIGLHVKLDNADVMRIAPGIVNDPDRDAAIHALRALLAVAGGSAHLPDLPRVAALFGELAHQRSRFSLARATIDNRKHDILLRRERRGKAGEELAAFRSPWAQFLPNFDLELAQAVARLTGLEAPPALPRP